MVCLGEELPEPGEIVVCKVTKVLDYGVFVELLEYSEAKGFVHISEVASRWVKNIRNFAKEGQIRAAKVILISHEKKQIDLSFTKVAPQLQRSKIEEYKQLKRSRKLIELLAESEKKSFDETWDSVAEPLIKEYGSLYAAFQEIAAKGEDALKSLDKKWHKLLLELVDKNIELSMKTIKGILSLQSLAPNGVEIIKNAIASGTSSTKDADIEIYYMGAGKYVIKVISPDYKVAERVLKYVSNIIIDAIKSSRGFAEFERTN